MAQERMGAETVRGAKSVATRAHLIDATLDCIRETGFTGLSVRAVATRADVNQALVFYHFESLAGLVRAAYGVALERAVTAYRAELLPVESLDVLADRAEAIVDHERDAGEGHGVLMVQLMAQAQHDAALAAVARHALGAWRALAREVVDEALAATSAARLIDEVALADGLVSALLGAVLVASVEDRAGAENGNASESGVSGLSALRDAARMVAALDALPAPVRRVVIAGLERPRRRGAEPRRDG